MGHSLVAVKANYVKQYFKRVGVYPSPSSTDFNEAIKHKIYVTEKEAEDMRDNKKLLSAFVSFRIIGENKLMSFGSGDTYSIVNYIAVDRKDFKAGEQLAFEQALVKFIQSHSVPVDVMQRTHLSTTGVVNYETMFGIHYTVLVPKECEKDLRRAIDRFGKSFNLKDLKGKYRDKLDGLSGMLIDHFREVKEEAENEDN